ncbi:unnamed protein product [Mycena citricolor]|uniref:Uncharacterized protein n=1 Tax=Mycena citricolor TaxID=2018698 RepID=A0AAD2GYL3_9AGAR|nr:unnamed protein product [Mycena citricolor]
MSGFSYAFWFDDSRNHEENEQVLEPSLGAVQPQIPPTISPSAFPSHAQDRFSPSLPPNSLEPSPFCMEESEPPRANPLIPELTPQMMPSPQALTARQCSHCGTTTLVWQQHPITASSISYWPKRGETGRRRTGCRWRARSNAHIAVQRGQAHRRRIWRR